MILRSRAIWASKGCVIGDAAVRVRGDRITGVGGYRDLLPDDDEPVVDIGESIIFPAFVNAHCHLEYSGLAGECLELFRLLIGLTKWSRSSRR